MPHTISILRLPWCQCLYVCTCERAYNAHTRYCRRQRMNSERENEWIFWFRFIFDSFSLSVLVVFVGITDFVREKMCRIAWSQLIADVFKRHIVYGVAAKRAMECYRCIGETFFIQEVHVFFRFLRFCCSFSGLCVFFPLLMVRFEKS